MMNRFLAFLFFVGFFTHAQHQDKVDFIRGKVFVEPLPLEKAIKGRVTYDFVVLQAVDSIFLDAKKMEFSSVLLDEQQIDFFNDGNIISVKRAFEKGDKHKLTLSYSAKPKQTLYFVPYTHSNTHKKNVAGRQQTPVNYQIWTQGQGKYTSHWLPSFDAMEEKVEFDLTIVAHPQLTVVANGKLIKREKGINTTTHTFDMKKPMCSYLLVFAIGDYDKQVLKSTNGTRIENYYYRADSLKVEPTYRYTQEIFEFLENEIGVPYAWQNYKQVPVKDFLYAGMENTTATIFSDGYVIDSTAFVDKNYVNVNAHELAHQWFGDLVTEKNGNHHWLHEGFATYYAQLAEQQIFGDDYYYWKLYGTLTDLQHSVTRGEGQQLTDAKASSLTFYEKGAWALYMLKNKMGATAFKKGIRKYLKKYSFKNVTITNFFEEMEAVTRIDLAAFKSDWIMNAGLPFEEGKKQLAKDSKSLKLLFALEAKQKTNTNIDYNAYWDKSTSIFFKKHLLTHYYEHLSETTLQKAFASNDSTIRQVIAEKMDTIPQAFKAKFESLLLDKSYVTVEHALFKLWSMYPKEKAKFLEQTKDIEGLPNKNVRLLWLTLAMLIPDYNSRQTRQYFEELSGYTEPKYGWEIRMSAFQYLNQAIGLNTKSLRSLINACVHHSWQFKKFARNLLDELLKDADYKRRLYELCKELEGDELRYMNTKIVNE